MKTARNKELDLLLEKFYNGVSLDYNKDRKGIYILVSDGYVNRVSSVNGSAYTITDKGRGFYLIGGYASKRKEKSQRLLRDLFVATLSAIITSLLQAIL